MGLSDTIGKLFDWRVILSLCLLLILAIASVFVLGALGPKAEPAVQFIGEIVAKFHPEGGGAPINLTSTVILRIPIDDDTKKGKSKFDDFHKWLVDRYGGWTRWKVESQTGADAIVERKYIYMIAIADRTRLGAGKVISEYVEETFGKPFLIIEVPENNAMERVPKGK